MAGQLISIDYFGNQSLELMRHLLMELKWKSMPLQCLSYSSLTIQTFTYVAHFVSSSIDFINIFLLLHWIKILCSLVREEMLLVYCLSDLLQKWVDLLWLKEKSFWNRKEPPQLKKMNMLLWKNINSNYLWSFTIASEPINPYEFSFSGTHHFCFENI